MINPSELGQRLQDDYSEAESTVQKSSRSLGVRRDKDTNLGFEPKALRVRGKIIGQSEFAAMNAKISETIDNLLSTSRIVDTAQAAEFKSEMEEKFRELKMEIFKSGLKMDKDIKFSKMKMDERAAIISALSGTAKGIGEMSVFEFNDRATQRQTTAVNKAGR